MTNAVLMEWHKLPGTTVHINHAPAHRPHTDREKCRRHQRTNCTCNST